MRELIPFEFGRAPFTWDIFDQVDKALNNVFGKDFFSNVEKSSYPKMNIYDKDNQLCIDAFIPEIPKDKVSIEYDENTGNISIIGNSSNSREDNEGNYYCREISKRAFKRVVKLPKHLLDTQKIEAKQEDGMYKIRIPHNKIENKTNNVKKIEVK